MFAFCVVQPSAEVRSDQGDGAESRHLCHIPHVAFIIESVHACLHRERPESAALSMPSGKLPFILTLECSGLEPSGCCRPDENH